MTKNVYIWGGMRTPLGSFQGQLSTVPATQLAATAIKALIDKLSFDRTQVEEVILGQVIQAGVGQSPARQAVIYSGLPESVPAQTVNKVCGSGLQAVINSYQLILSDQRSSVIAVGMENMSLAPHYFPARNGIKFGSLEVKDSMQIDGLWDVYTQRSMGECAEQCLSELKISRQRQDDYAIESFKKAQLAIESKRFESEIAPVRVKNNKIETEVSVDEGPGKANFSKMLNLKPAFKADGTITAANASTINDGAAALLLSSEKSKGNLPCFRVLGWASHAQNPTWFTTAPIEAIRKNIAACNLKISDIDLFELNEAFAMVNLAAIDALNIPVEKMNIFGGAIALGHPIGCSGARILVTLMNAMTYRNARLGLASACIGGGEALSIIIERQ